MSDNLTVQQKALLAIKRLQERVAELEAREHEPVAIIGIGCRFPSASTYDAFGDRLAEGRDLVRELPPERFEPLGNERVAGQRVTGAFLDGVEHFDAPFFRISREECATLDPQQRFLLETSWEAIEDAGIDPSTLRESACGVFFGVSNSDYRILLNNHGIANRYRTTGASFAAATGRVAYFLGLQGPNISIDTACSSSLVAVYMACQSLRSHHCNLALAGGANLMVAAPTTSRFTEQASMLSPTSRCHAFDAAADGYVRGEGVAVILLKRLKDALADGDPIHAIIRGAATNHNGPTSGLTVPGPDAQAKLMRAALADARVTALDVQYLEAHGTGTSLGDPIELRGSMDVYGSRPPASPLLVGSVKTNIGHLENAAGIAGSSRSSSR